MNEVPPESRRQPGSSETEQVMLGRLRRASQLGHRSRCRRYGPPRNLGNGTFEGALGDAAQTPSTRLEPRGQGHAQALRRLSTRDLRETKLLCAPASQNTDAQESSCHNRRVRQERCVGSECRLEGSSAVAAGPADHSEPLRRLVLLRPREPPRLPRSPEFTLTPSEAEFESRVRADRACGPLGSQARCRQPPLSAAADSRLRARGSSPVIARYATGICRRRVTPSFW